MPAEHLRPDGSLAQGYYCARCGAPGCSMLGHIECKPNPALVADLARVNGKVPPRTVDPLAELAKLIVQDDPFARRNPTCGWVALRRTCLRMGCGRTEPCDKIATRSNDGLPRGYTSIDGERPSYRGEPVDWADAPRLMAEKRENAPYLFGFGGDVLDKPEFSGRGEIAWPREKAAAAFEEILRVIETYGGGDQNIGPREARAAFDKIAALATAGIAVVKP